MFYNLSLKTKLSKNLYIKKKNKRFVPKLEKLSKTYAL